MINLPASEISKQEVSSWAGEYGIGTICTIDFLPKDAAEMKNHSGSLYSMPLIYHALHLLPARRAEFICYCPKPVTCRTAF